MKKWISILLMTATLLAAMPVSAKNQDYKGHWAESAIKKWHTLGVISGYEDGSIKPNNKVTRAEFATMLGKVFGTTGAVSSVVCEDIKASDWYSGVATNGIHKGWFIVKNGKFNPHLPITREEAAYALAVAFGIETGKTSNFSDRSKIDTMLQSHVEALAAAGYIGGYEDGSFRPKGNLTRAEAVAMLDKLVNQHINYATQTSGFTYTGNVVVAHPKVTLKDLTINGNLYLTEAIADGKVTLNNVKVSGNIYVMCSKDAVITSVKPLGEEIREGVYRQNYKTSTLEGILKIKGVPRKGIEVVLWRQHGNGYSTSIAKTITDANGYYSFKELDYDAYRLTAVHIEGYEGYSFGESDIKVEKPVLTYDIDIKDISESLHFNIVSETGMPIEGASISGFVSATIINDPSVKATNWSLGGISNKEGKIAIISGYQLKVGTTIPFTIEKAGYKTYTGQLKTNSSHSTVIDVVLEKNK